MRRRILLACACAASVPLAGFVSTALAQPDLTQKAGPSVADAPSDSYRFDRFELDAADGARRYRVQLAVPRRVPPPAGFPVLYLLDGNAAFAALTQAQLASMAAQETPPVIAAIGYATDLRFDVVARTCDYTPPLPEGGDSSAAVSSDAARGRRTGGADVFLDLIETSIKPAVLSRTTIDAARQSLWGHSYGGLARCGAALRGAAGAAAGRAGPAARIRRHRPRSDAGAVARPGHRPRCRHRPAVTPLLPMTSRSFLA